MTLEQNGRWERLNTLASMDIIFKMKWLIKFRILNMFDELFFGGLFFWIKRTNINKEKVVVNIKLAINTLKSACFSFWVIEHIIYRSVVFTACSCELIKKGNAQSVISNFPPGFNAWEMTSKDFISSFILWW